MGNTNRQKQHELLNSLITMSEGALMACVHVQGGAPLSAIPDVVRNTFAELLAQLVTIYAISEDRAQVRALTIDDIRGGTFRDGGREIVFGDGRETIRGLALSRPALQVAIATLRRLPYYAIPRYTHGDGSERTEAGSPSYK
jgi:hypothetical protein